LFTAHLISLSEKLDEEDKLKSLILVFTHCLVLLLAKFSPLSNALAYLYSVISFTY